MSGKKVVLLNPPTESLRFSRDGRCQSDEHAWLDAFPPTTFACIAGCVREKHEVDLIDCIGDRISYQECFNRIERFKPDFIVINTSTPTITNDLKIGNKLKESTKAKLILYGEHVSARYEKLFEEHNFIDYVILGEPETPIMKILAGESKTKGVATSSFTGGYSYEEDLDSLPFPAYDLMPFYYYPLTLEKWMFIRSGRGCPYGCTYCVMPMLGQRKVRYHSPEYMVKQIKWLVEKLDIKLYMLWDELSTFDKPRMIKFCKLLIESKLPKKIKWFCTTRVDCFDQELAMWMSRAGCRMMSFGFESGDQKVLDYNKKGSRLDQAYLVVKSAKKYGIKVIGHFIVGLPASSKEGDSKTIELAKELKINFAQFYIATPFPGSEFYKQAVENNWIVNNDWSKIEQGTASISYPTYSSEKIKALKERAYREFYLRPYAVYSLLTSISLRVLFKIPGYIFNFFRLNKIKNSKGNL